MANQRLGDQARFTLKLVWVASRAKVIGFTATVLGLVGCAMGPDYQRPDVDLPAQYHHELVQDTIDNDGLVAWQSFYLDPNVRKLISYALAQNLDLEAVRSRLIAARSKVTVTDATLYPEFGLGANAERSIDSGITNTNPTHGNEFDIAGTVSWELDVWGANRRRSEAEYAHFLSTQEALNLAVISLISDVASRYYEWLDIEQRYQISVNTVQLRKKERDLARLRKQNGVISGLQVKQAEVEYQSAKVTLPSLDFARQEKANQLRVLLGEYDYPLKVEGDLASLIAEVPFPSSFRVGIPSQMLSQRPDVKAAELALIAANANVGLAKTAFFPKFNITGRYGTESEDLDKIFDSQGVTWSLLGGITAPIFNAGSIAAQYDIAQEESRQALLAYRSAVLAAYFEVNDAMNSFRRSELAIEAQEELVEAARGYTHLAMLRYRNGVSSSLDLMDAQRSLFNAELSLSEVRRDKLLAMIKLYRSLGGGVLKEEQQTQTLADKSSRVGDVQ
ncbi:efflux transporter outer membrane subunit [Shewanella psychrotolerans]|uniref:efflux transporter outer membrane subunit n=1 Tax=Shewanella psychrotolerans TaxID=2864206 RepID=UPI001C65D1D6|nr:efflux transporter outer membrane subunit [Shewanella psychrotolerans]QYK00638.1 efflux transporter outer membrane subunit [Shewanella psychrotolerans]